MNTLESHESPTTAAVDTGPFVQLAWFKPRDATTNPSLIRQGRSKPSTGSC